MSGGGSARIAEGYREGYREGVRCAGDDVRGEGVRRVGGWWGEGVRRGEGWWGEGDGEH